MRFNPVAETNGHMLTLYRSLGELVLEPPPDAADGGRHQFRVGSNR
jgi:hypothetical protein